MTKSREIDRAVSSFGLRHSFASRHSNFVISCHHERSTPGSSPPNRRRHSGLSGKQPLQQNAARQPNDARRHQGHLPEAPLVPPPENFALLQEHTVTEGERLDQIAAKYLGDPEQFWKLCDANGAIQPNELLDPVGRTIRITLPENIPGAQNG